MSTTPFPLPIMLDAADRKALRARAHHLDPVVMIGDAGLTRAVLDEADRALRVHELIKIRVLGDDREHRMTLSTEICSALGCAPVQSIGKLLVLYRPRPIEDTDAKARPRGPHVPKKRAAAGTAGASKKTAGAAAPRTSRKPQRAGAPVSGRAAGDSRADGRTAGGRKPAANRNAAKPAARSTKPAVRGAKPAVRSAKPAVRSAKSTARSAPGAAAQGAARRPGRAGATRAAAPARSKKR